jgi:hypothetical protein
MIFITSAIDFKYVKQVLIFNIVLFFLLIFLIYLFYNLFSFILGRKFLVSTQLFRIYIHFSFFLTFFPSLEISNLMNFLN